MNYRTQDVIVWDGFPHPDPRSRHGEASVRIAPSFWSRLAQHVRDARPCAPARALWENWLTPQGVNALASRTAVDLDDAFTARGPRTATTAGVRRDAGDLPPVAVERLRETIASSLEAPLAMCFHTTGATSSSRPALYCLVLTNGATLTLRGDLDTLEAEDCFFSRAAIEASHEAVAAAAARTDVQGESLRHEFNDVTAAAALLATGIGAFQFLQSGTAAPALPANAAAGTTTSLRAAVAGEMVRRYAAVDENKQLVLPDGGAARGADLSCKRVSFLEPRAWGFADSGTGSRWTGVIGFDFGKPAGKGHTNGSRSLNHSIDPTDSTLQNVNGNANRISYPGTPARMNGNGSHMPRPMPSNPPAAPARPASDRLLPTEPTSDDLRTTAAARADGIAHLEQRTAYRALVALGECRVFGFTTGEADLETTASVLVLPADLAIAAASELERRLARWTADAEDLRDRLLTAGGVAAEDLRLGLLESRMEAWAAYLTLDSSYNTALDAADPDADRLSQAVDSILTRIEAFDEALQLCEPCLAISDETPLLANWRKVLADAYRDTPPWWLERTPALAGPQ
jgi:hypothetical protein